MATADTQQHNGVARPHEPHTRRACPDDARRRGATQRLLVGVLQYAALLHKVSRHVLPVTTPEEVWRRLTTSHFRLSRLRAHPGQRCAVNCPPTCSSARSSATPGSARLITLSIAHRDALLSPATLSSTSGDQQRLQAYYHRCQRRGTATRQSHTLSPFHFRHSCFRSRYH